MCVIASSKSRVQHTGSLQDPLYEIKGVVSAVMGLSWHLGLSWLFVCLSRLGLHQPGLKVCTDKEVSPSVIISMVWQLSFVIPAAVVCMCVCVGWDGGETVFYCVTTCSHPTVMAASWLEDSIKHF